MKVLDSAYHTQTRPSLADAILDGLGDLIWVVDNNHQIVYANSHTIEFLDLDYEKTRPIDPGKRHAWLQERWLNAIHPDDRIRVIESWLESMKTGKVYEIERRLRRSGDGLYRWMLVRMLPMRNADGVVTNWLGIAADIHENRKRIERIEALQSATAALSQALTLDEVLKTILQIAVSVVEADASFVARYDEASNTIKSLGSTGYTQEIQERFADVALTRDLPIGFTYLTGEALYLETQDEIIRRFPKVRVTSESSGDQALAVLPLKVGQANVGVFAFAFRRHVKLDDELKSFLLTLTQLYSHALERARLFDLERNARKFAEAEKLRFLNVLEDLPAAISIVSGPEFRFEFVNAYYRQHLGMDREQLIGRTIVEAHPELKNHEVVRKAEEVYRTGDTYASLEQAILKPQADGSFKVEYWSGQSMAWRDTTGRIEGVVTFAVDVTDHVVARKKIETSEERLRLALSASRVGLWEWNAVQKQAWVSKQYCEIYGFEEIPTDWSYESVISHAIPEDRSIVATTLSPLLHPGSTSTFEGEWRIHTAQHDVRWIRDDGKIERGADGIVMRVFGSITDITAVKAAEAELRQAKDEAEAANRAKTSFVANMSHEFRTPLTAILGFAEFLGKDTLSPEKRAQYVSGIRRNGEALIKLIQDILDLSRVESGHISVDPQPLNMVTLITEVIMLFTDQASAKGVGISFIQENDGTEDFVSDPVRLRQVLINIIGNAVKFTEQGQVKIKLNFLSGPPMQARITVEDTGIGIADDQRKRLFHPFGQADQSTRRRFGGTGLGLFISQKISHVLGGKLELTATTPGIGSCFTIHIPDLSPALVSSTSERKSFAAYDRHKVIQEIKGTKVLVVEDTRDICELLKTHFDELQVQSDFAFDGLEGLKKAKAKKYDVIVMDLHMPKMDGYTATEKIRKLKITTPIIAITARAQPEDRSRCISSGFNAYLSNPINLDELDHAIHEFSVTKQS